MLIDTNLGTKVSFGGVLDSSSDLGAVKESYLIRLINRNWLWNTAFFVIKFLQVNKVRGITEHYIILKQCREYVSWNDSYILGQILEEEIDSHLMGIEFFISAAFAQNTVPFVVLPL